MDLLSLYYFSEVAKDLHITRTANRLYISQQSLSNHIQRLEKHYGVELFRRKPSLQLTLAGEEVLRFAETMTQGNANLQDVLFDMKQQERAVLRFGASTGRLNVCLPVISKYVADYPNIELRLHNRFSRDLEQMVMDNELDLALVIGMDKSLKVEELCHYDDTVYLCVPDELLYTYYGEQAEEIKGRSVEGARLEWFSKLPFCVMDNRMGEQIQRCFERAGFRPNIFMTSTYAQACTTACYKGLAACFIPQMNLIGEDVPIPKDINVFPLSDQEHPIVQTLSLICYRERYLPQYAKELIDRLSARFTDIQSCTSVRVVNNRKV